MADDELLSHKRDKGRGMFLPREGDRRKNGLPPKGSPLWAMRETLECEPEAVWGQYPKGFVREALRLLGAQPSEVLHLCSGSLRRGQGIRVDLRVAARPDVRANACQLPFRDASFRAVLIDPPYTQEYARDLYGVAYPRPSWLLAEASRVLQPGGRVGILHFLVPKSGPGLDLELVRGVTTGAGYRIRAFSVYRREQPRLL